jgi:hypothetical protein
MTVRGDRATSAIILERSSPAEAKPAPLAQLDRASGYEPEGREFESLRAHHLTLSKLYGITRNSTVLCSVPADVVTSTMPVVAPGGTVAVR